MWRCGWSALWVVLVVWCGGCQMGGQVTTERTVFQEFEGAWRASDGRLEVVAIPEGGRVMVLRRVGEASGENLLWVNPEIRGPVAKRGDAFFWANYGGDKTWPWSQGDWEKVFGVAGWPPPAAFDSARFRITPIARGLRLEGPVAVGQRMRVVREVTLMGDGRRLRVLSRIEAVGMGHEHAIAAWTVTQLPWPDEVRVERVGAWEAMPPERREWPGAEVVGGDLVLPGSAGGSAKVGADGVALVYRRGDVVVRQRVVSANAGRLEPMEQLQVFRTERTGGKGDYIELEVTGPRVSVRPGRPAELVVEWEVVR